MASVTPNLDAWDAAFQTHSSGRLYRTYRSADGKALFYQWGDHNGTLILAQTNAQLSRRAAEELMTPRFQRTDQLQNAAVRGVPPRHPSTEYTAAGTARPSTTRPIAIPYRVPPGNSSFNQSFSVASSGGENRYHQDSRGSFGDLSGTPSREQQQFGTRSYETRTRSDEQPTSILDTRQSHPQELNIRQVDFSPYSEGRQDSLPGGRRESKESSYNDRPNLLNSQTGRRSGDRLPTIAQDEYRDRGSVIEEVERFTAQRPSSGVLRRQSVAQVSTLPTLPEGVLATSTKIRSKDNSSAEKLDPRYKMRKSDFFKLGKVFAMLWHESNTRKTANNTDLSMPRFATKDRYGEEVYTTIRRMIIVRECHGYCLCIPIVTYEKKGCLKPGLSREEVMAHTVAYMIDDPQSAMPAEVQKGMTKDAIAIKPTRADQKLHDKSRINFGKVYTVMHNVKVMDVGQVADADGDLYKLLLYFQSAIGGIPDLNRR